MRANYKQYETKTMKTEKGIANGVLAQKGFGRGLPLSVHFLVDALH